MSGYLKRLREDCANLIDALVHYLEIGDLRAAYRKSGDLMDRIDQAHRERDEAEEHETPRFPFSLPHMQRRCR